MSGVDSGVAHLVGLGNAKALYSGMSDEVQTLTLFSYLWKPKTNLWKPLAGEALGKQKDLKRMGQIENIKNRVRNLPEFSENNYSIVGYVFAALITLAGGYFIYEVLTTDTLTFKANWNMFKSPLGNLCWIIGLVWAIAWWGKFFHWSAIPIMKTYDRDGNLKKVEEDFDIINQMFAKILMPFLGHFVIEPLIYAAVIYYPLQCIIAVVGTVFPYILSLIVLGIIAGSWMFTRTFQFRYHSVVLVALGVLFTVAFAWGGYAIGKTEPGGTIQMLAGSEASPSSETVRGGIAAGETGTTEETESETVASDLPDGEEAEEDNQFEGVGEEGLYGSLPDGTTEYVGDMSGYPIEFTITKSSDTGDATAIYKNVKYGTSMEMSGESLPAMGGDINFYGKDGNTDWVFSLTGDADNITGTAQSGDSELNITLHKK